MSSAASQPRTNSLAFAKTDCHTCAAQRRKCDRRRPRCSPCLSNGVKCGGFPMQLSWSRRKPAAPREARILDEAEDPFYLEPLSLKMAAHSKARDRRHHLKPPQQFKFVANESSSRKRPLRQSSRPSSPARPSQRNEPHIQASSQRRTEPETELADQHIPQVHTFIAPGETISFEHQVIRY
jgi:hypothetical protein